MVKLGFHKSFFELILFQTSLHILSMFLTESMHFVYRPHPVKPLSSTESQYPISTPAVTEIKVRDSTAGKIQVRIFRLILPFSKSKYGKIPFSPNLTNTTDLLLS